MPTCSYFIKGACGQDRCPYAHTYVGHDAQICDDFVQGFCSKGNEVLCRWLLSSVDVSVFICVVYEATCSSLSSIRSERSMSSGKTMSFNSSTEARCQGSEQKDPYQVRLTSLSLWTGQRSLFERSFRPAETLSILPASVMPAYIPLSQGSLSPSRSLERI